MLDIIFESRVFELSMIYGWGDLNVIFAGAMESNNPNIVSTLERTGTVIQTAIDRTVDAILSNEN